MYGFPKQFRRAHLSASGLFAATLAASMAFGGASQAAGVCPSAGQDTGCGFTITIGQTGATVTPSGQGPYDGNDDTLIGVINNSTTPIAALGLRSGSGIFGFDSDGVTTFGAPGNPRDTTGYGGPNAYYTNVGAGAASGIVNFVAPIASGGSSYFSLENSLTKAVSIRDIVNNALTVTASGANITATFVPNLGLTLAQAEQIGGFKDFDWIQKITGLPDPSPFFARNNGTPLHLTSASVPFNDPPAGGGYSYQGTPDNSYPFYYDRTGELATHQTASTLSFFDAPADPCLAGGNSAGVPGCNGANAPAGSKITFSTELAGVTSAGAAVPLGVGFTWSSDFNGTAGGVAVTKNPFGGVDAGSGTGGTTILTLNQITNLVDPNSFFVDTVNGQPVNSTGSLTPGLPTPDPNLANVPEPSTFAVLAIGLAGSLRARRCSRRSPNRGEA